MHRLRLTEALRIFNTKAKEGPGRKKMTLERLSPVVFEGTDVSKGSGMAYLSKWNNGELMERLEEIHRRRVAKALGVEEGKLIEDEPAK